MPAESIRLQLLFNRLLQAPRELQETLIQRSGCLRSDLLERIQFGDPLAVHQNAPGSSMGVRDYHVSALEESHDSTHMSTTRLDALQRPMFLLENPAKGISESMVSMCHAGHALILTSLENIMPNAERQTLLRLLSGTMIERDAKRRKGRLHQVAGSQLQRVQGSAILRANTNALNAMILDPDIAGAFVAVIPADSGTIPSVFHPSDSYAEAIRKVIEARRTGALVACEMLDTVNARKFASQHLEFLREIENARDPALRAFSSLPMALAWTLSVLSPDAKQSDDWVLRHAVPSARKLMRRQQKLLARLRNEELLAKTARVKARLTRRLGNCGPMTRRELARGLSRQNISDYGIPLQELIDGGLVKADGGILQLAPSGPTASTRRRPANIRC